MYSLETYSSPDVCSYFFLKSLFMPKQTFVRHCYSSTGSESWQRDPAKQFPCSALAIRADRNFSNRKHSSQLPRGSFITVATIDMGVLESWVVNKELWGLPIHQLHVCLLPIQAIHQRCSRYKGEAGRNLPKRSPRLIGSRYGACNGICMKTEGLC